MTEYRIDVNKYWTPWEHEVCQLCFNENPNAVWLVKVGCFKPHQHEISRVRVVIDHECMAMASLRTVSTVLFWRIGKYKMCDKMPNCNRGSRCLFPHSRYELDMWNLRSRMIKGGKYMRGSIILLPVFLTQISICLSNFIFVGKKKRRLASELCAADLNSQCPSEVCQVCLQDNPGALWLAWLSCVDTERHKNKTKVAVVANSKEKKLIEVRPLPWAFTQLDEVERATHTSCTTRACQQAHSAEELLYWQWQLARKLIFENVSFIIDSMHLVPQISLAFDICLYKTSSSTLTIHACVKNMSTPVSNL